MTGSDDAEVATVQGCDRLDPQPLGGGDHRSLLGSQRVVEPTERVEVVTTDPADDRVLEAALESTADVIVSGDKHLLQIRLWRGIRIVSPADLLAEFESR